MGLLRLLVVGEADGARAKGVGVVVVGGVVIKGSSEAADEGVEGTPGLAEGAREPKEGAAGDVHLRLPKLVQVHPHRPPLVPQVLQECVPVPPLLVLVPPPLFPFLSSDDW